MTTLLPILHIGPSSSDQASTWLLGVAAGYILAVVVNRAIRLRGPITSQHHLGEKSSTMLSSSRDEFRR